MEFNFNEIVQIIQIIISIVAIVPLFLAYYFFKKQYKFKTSHDRVVKVNDKMSELTSDLDDFVLDGLSSVLDSRGTIDVLRNGFRLSDILLDFIKE